MVQQGRRPGDEAARPGVKQGRHLLLEQVGRSGLAQVDAGQQRLPRPARPDAPLHRGVLHAQVQQLPAADHAELLVQELTQTADSHCNWHSTEHDIRFRQNLATERTLVRAIGMGPTSVPEPATGWAEAVRNRRLMLSAPPPANQTAGAVGALFREHHRELVRLVLPIVGTCQTAEDVVQDVYASLHKRWSHSAAPTRSYRTS